MNKFLKKLLAFAAAGTAAVFAHLFVKDRMEFGSSYKRTGRWY